MRHSPRFTTHVQAIRCLACQQELTLLDGAVWASQQDGPDCPHAITGGWWRLEVSEDLYLDADDLALIAELIVAGFTSGQIVHTPTGDENRLVIIPIRTEETPTDDPWALAWGAFTSGTPREDLKPEIRANCDAAVAAGIAHWAPVTATGTTTPYWRLRWNFPDPTKRTT